MPAGTQAGSWAVCLPTCTQKIGSSRVHVRFAADMRPVHLEQQPLLGSSNIGQPKHIQAMQPYSALLISHHNRLRCPTATAAANVSYMQMPPGVLAGWSDQQRQQGHHQGSWLAGQISGSKATTRGPGWLVRSAAAKPAECITVPDGKMVVPG